jgi:hypothetical protein
MTCVSSSIELESEATKTPEVKPFNIINDEQQKQKHAASQFFSSLLVRKLVKPTKVFCSWPSFERNID